MSYLKNTFALLLFASSFLISYAVLKSSFNNIFPKQEETEAYDALNFWAESRAYPLNKFPQEGYAAAFEKLRQMKSPLDYSWEPIGPVNFGGRTISIAVNPQNNRTIFAGSASGGLWQSYTAGEGAEAWHKIITGFPVLGVSAIAISRTDTNLIFIGTGEVYAYQNSTGGIVDRLTRGSYGIGILKTTDGGITWSKALDWSMNQERGVQTIKFNPKNENTIYAGTTEGVFVSYNSGNLWEQISGTPMVTDLAINPNDTNKILIACGNFDSPHKGIYLTTNAGESWTIINSDLPTDYEGKTVFYMYPETPDTVLASIGGGLSGTWLCRTTDFGINWEIVSTFDYAKYQGWYSHVVVGNPNEPDKILAAGVDIYKSTNDGSDFTQKSYWYKWYMGRTVAGEEEGPADYSHADHHCFAVDPQNPNIIYFGNDGGIFKTTDFGETFHGRNGGYQTQQFYNGFSSNWSNGKFSIGGLQDNASAIYDGQSNWIRILGADGAWTAINFDDPNVIFGSYYYLNLYRSTNAGNSWSRLSLPDAGNSAFISPYVVSPANSNIMYAAGSKVIKSSRQGITWEFQSEPSPNPAISMAASFQNEDKLYVGFAPENGTLEIKVTTDGGLTWNDISDGLPNRYPMDIAVDPNDDNIVYIVFSGFGTSHVFRSFNGGVNWEDINGNLPDVPTNAVAVDPTFTNNIYVGNDVGVFYSYDYGDNWTALTNGLPGAVLVMDLSVAYGSDKIIAATHGNGAFVTDLQYGTDVESENADNPSGFALQQNYPNPFNPTTTIKYTIPNVGNVETLHATSLRVYNILGEEIATLVNEQQSPGNYTVQFNASNLPSGVYFYTLRFGDFSATKKMILLK